MRCRFCEQELGAHARKCRSCGEWLQQRWRHQSYGNYISFFALLVSCCALYLTVEEMRRAREHDRLSVRPNLAVGFAADAVTGCQVYTENVGLGPAVVKTFEVFVDTKARRNWEEVIRALELPRPVVSVGWFPVVRADNARHILLSIEPSPACDLLLKNWARVNITWCMCSFYEDPRECRSASIRGPQEKKLGPCPTEPAVFNPRDPVG